MKIKEFGNKIILEIDLMNLSDNDLVCLRNRVTWECKRRIKLGIDIN